MKHLKAISFAAVLLVGALDTIAVAQQDSETPAVRTDPPPLPSDEDKQKNCLEKKTCKKATMPAKPVDTNPALPSTAASTATGKTTN